MQNRRQFIKSSLTASAGLSAGFLSNCQSSQKPNIVFIFSDQQHWHALGCMDEFFDTPHQNDFAKNSVVFENGFCTTPQCSPSRSSILTGFYPHKTGVLGNMGAAGGDPLNQPTIINQLKNAGYNTAYSGKWHLGNKKSAQSGIDHFLTNKGGSGQLSDEPTTQDGLLLLEDKNFTLSPFALFLSYVDPHDIYMFKNHKMDTNSVSLPKSYNDQDFSTVPHVHKQFMTQDQGAAIWNDPVEKWKQYRDCYRAKVKLYDDHFGRIINEIKNQGLWDNTIIVNTSDHGDMDTHNHLIWKGPFMYDHMVRVPFMIRVPEKLGGQNNRRIKNLDVVNVDFAPTLLSLCGIKSNSTDGISLKPTLMNSGLQTSREFVIGQYYSKQKWVNPIRMIRTSDFKYNIYILENGAKITKELYDLKNDPDEVNNLAYEQRYETIKNNLEIKLDNWIKNNNDPFYDLYATDRNSKKL